MNSPIAIIGAGGWGTALAITMARHGKDVRLWAYERYVVETMVAARENPLYLPSVRVPESILIRNSMPEVLADAGIGESRHALCQRNQRHRERHIDANVRGAG